MHAELNQSKGILPPGTAGFVDHIGIAVTDELQLIASGLDTIPAHQIFDFLKEYCEVKYLERTQDISTTQLKKSLTNFLSIPKEDILKAFEILEALKKDFS